MQGFEDLLSTMAALASALGCGLLVGVERERRKGEGPFRSLAGVRSFALASLAGASADGLCPRSLGRPRRDH